MVSEGCPRCGREFKYQEFQTPQCGALIQPANIEGTYVKMCPLCYAEEVMRIHKCMWFPQGEIAAEAYELAKRCYPEWLRQYRKKFYRTARRRKGKQNPKRKGKHHVKKSPS